MFFPVFVFLAWVLLVSVVMLVRAERTTRLAEPALPATSAVD